MQKIILLQEHYISTVFFNILKHKVKNFELNNYLSVTGIISIHNCCVYYTQYNSMLYRILYIVVIQLLLFVVKVMFICSLVDGHIMVQFLVQDVFSGMQNKVEMAGIIIIFVLKFMEENLKVFIASSCLFYHVYLQRPSQLMKTTTNHETLNVIMQRIKDIVLRI